MIKSLMVNLPYLVPSYQSCPGKVAIKCVLLFKIDLQRMFSCGIESSCKGTGV